MTPELWAEAILRETTERHGGVCWPGVDLIADAVRRAAADARADEREAVMRLFDAHVRGIVDGLGTEDFRDAVARRVGPQC